MELRASLDHLHLTSPDPERVAAFYCRTYGMTSTREDTRWVCTGAGRKLMLSPGPANQLHYALYRFADTQAWQAFKDRVPGAAQVDLPVLPGDVADAVACRDPEGNTLVFAAPSAAALETAAVPGTARDLPQAHLQHFALRTTQAQAMLDFYETLGFVLSDRVQDEHGNLRACFLRTESLHHSLALFGAPVSCFDHQSFETGSWDDMRVWGDRMAELREPIVWGIGRHGPGNDVFFMVKDPDGNLAEISAEIEVCEADRPAGTWVHEERTLNLWGKAIMRG